MSPEARKARCKRFAGAGLCMACGVRPPAGQSKKCYNCLDILVANYNAKMGNRNALCVCKQAPPQRPHGKFCSTCIGPRLPKKQAPWTVDRCMSAGLCVGLTYIGSRAPVANVKEKWRCELGHISEKKPCSVSRCGRCVKNRKWTIEEVKLLSFQAGFIYVAGEYKSNRSKLTFRCVAKGHETQKTFFGIRREVGCPRCQKGGSREMQDFVFGLVTNKFSDALCEVRGLLPSRKLEIDIWIPSRRVGIEVDGWSHHRGDPKIKERDTRKTRECEASSIRLFRISQHSIRWPAARARLETHINNLLEQI